MVLLIGSDKLDLEHNGLYWLYETCVDEITYPRSYEIRFDDVFYRTPYSIHEVPVDNFCRPLGISVGDVKNRHRGLAWPSCRHELLFARNPQLIFDPQKKPWRPWRPFVFHVLSLCGSLKKSNDVPFEFSHEATVFWSASMSAMLVRFPIQQWFEFEFPKQI